MLLQLCNHRSSGRVFIAAIPLLCMSAVKEFFSVEGVRKFYQSSVSFFVFLFITSMFM